MTDSTRPKFTPGQMDASAVTAYVNAKWPEAAASPFAKAVREYTQAEMIADAKIHAQDCISQACGDRWALDDLAFNIESNFPEFEPDDCLDIAEWALANPRAKVSP